MFKIYMWEIATKIGFEGGRKGRGQISNTIATRLRPFEVHKNANIGQ